MGKEGDQQEKSNLDHIYMLTLNLWTTLLVRSS